MCPKKAKINPQTFRQATSALCRLNIARENIGFGKKFSSYCVRLSGFLYSGAEAGFRLFGC